MKIFRAVFLFVLTFFLVYILQNRLADTFLASYTPATLATAPPIGKFLDPFSGFWANAEAKRPKDKLNLSLNSLQKKVEILIDQRFVPHIFAENDQDLYFAQGYIMASQRLWQMEFLTHLAAGRLSEVLGERAIEIDRSQRRIGMLASAEATLKNVMKDSVSAQILNAYAAGVNAYINSLEPHQYPLEYKILDYAPEAWTPLKTALMLKYMAYDLSLAYNHDFANTLAAHLYSEKAVDSAFSSTPFQMQPVIPSKTPLDFKPAKKPQRPNGYDSVSKKIAKNLDEVQNLLLNIKSEEKPKGSNNWAIGAKKSETGFPILAGDPHLSLKLPSIWYEMQLVSPNVNVYGVSLPGTPTVVIGFNDKIAWSITSAYTDAADWYLLQFKDEKLEEYWHDGTWKKTSLRKEVIKVRGAKQPVFEYIRHSHHGAILLEKKSTFNPNKANSLYNLEAPFRSALQWIGADSTSNEVLTFHKLNRANNYTEFVQAFATFACPSLVVAYADIEKNIGLYVAGKIPMRWNEQGKYILDGTSSAYEYRQFIPYEHNPKVLNPEQQFVASANQFIADTLTYPYYTGYDFVSPERGIRINERLAAMSRIKLDNVRELQNDVLGVHARQALPAMLAYLDTTKLEKEAEKILSTLKKWNYLYQTDSQGATFFEVWFAELRKELWDDEFGKISSYPNTDQTLRILLKDTNSRWIDKISTPEKENLQMLVKNSFSKALVLLKEKHKGEDENWFWGKHKGFSLQHLLIPHLGFENLMTSGSSRTVNATGSDHGPSWRMVVMLGANSHKAYGVYPGGQSGNPGSFYYANMVENWRLGELEELLYLKNAPKKHPKILTIIEMKKNE
ncbi:MAG: penicillin acylase family protein [Raineya sp.]